MSDFLPYYDNNPVAKIDQNLWDYRIAEVVEQFRNQVVVFTPLVDWKAGEGAQFNGAKTTVYTEMLEGDVTTDEVPFTANYITDTTGVDSRSRTLSTKRYGDKVILHSSSNIYQMWNLPGGGRDWRPVLRGLLASNIIRKHEILSRNAFLLAPSVYRTYAGGGASFADIGATDTFDPDIINEWHLRLGNTGSPVIPGDQAAAKLAILPPGVHYDLMKKLPTAANNKLAMWRDANMYAGAQIKYEIGSMDGVRFQQCPNNRYGENLSVLYNAGELTYQCGVSSPIKMGDGAPDPESTTKVDDVWSVGQKAVTHFIQLEGTATMTNFAAGDLVTVHVKRTADFGITDGVDFRDGRSVTRKIVSVDAAGHTLSFDRPIMFNYDSAFRATPNGMAAQSLYAFVTKARHIGMVLALGSRGGIMGKVDKPLSFYEPKPVDDFDSVWRFVWDEFAGYNLWEPNLYEVYFCAVTLPKPGGIITP